MNRAENIHHNKNVEYKKRGKRIKESHSTAESYETGAWLLNKKSPHDHDGKHYRRDDEYKYRKGGKNSK